MKLDQVILISNNQPTAIPPGAVIINNGSLQMIEGLANALTAFLEQAGAIVQPASQPASSTKVKQVSEDVEKILVPGTNVVLRSSLIWPIFESLRSTHMRTSDLSRSIGSPRSSTLCSLLTRLKEQGLIRKERIGDAKPSWALTGRGYDLLKLRIVSHVDQAA